LTYTVLTLVLATSENPAAKSLFLKEQDYFPERLLDKIVEPGAKLTASPNSCGLSSEYMPSIVSEIMQSKNTAVASPQV